MNLNNLLLAAGLLVGVAYPLYAMFEGHKVRVFLEESPNQLTRVLLQSIVLLLSSLTIVLVAMNYAENSINIIGLEFVNSPWKLAILVAIPFLSVWLLGKISLTEESAKQLEEKLLDVSYLMPKTKPEYRVGLITAVVAGVAEEVVFRGFLYELLVQYISVIFSILIVNVLFALAHIGTKFKNFVSSFILGLIWSVTYYFTESLWLPIATHMLIDIYSITLGYKVYRKLS